MPIRYAKRKSTGYYVIFYDAYPQFEQVFHNLGGKTFLPENEILPLFFLQIITSVKFLHLTESV